MHPRQLTIQKQSRYHVPNANCSKAKWNRQLVPKAIHHIKRNQGNLNLWNLNPMQHPRQHISKTSCTLTKLHPGQDAPEATYTKGNLSFDNHRKNIKATCTKCKLLPRQLAIDAQVNSPYETINWNPMQLAAKLTQFILPYQNKRGNLNLMKYPIQHAP